MSFRKNRRENQALKYQVLEPRQVLASILPVDAADVVGRYVFYNESVFDGNDASANAADYNAIAPDKVALLAGETAKYENITNFDEGINGIIIDVDGLANASGFSANDIVLSTGGGENSPVDDLSDLSLLNVTPQVSVDAGAGVGGSDRITLILPNGSVTNEFLQVRVLANDTTGLFSDDVFYFGNIVGETGDSLTDNRVGGLDISGVQSNLTGLFSVAEIDNHYDFDRDGRVGGLDISTIQSNLSGLFNEVSFVTTPPAEDPPATTPTLPAGDFFVTSASDLENVLSQVQAGDTIVLANGVYTNQHFELTGNGTQNQPITLRAETPGHVVLNGSSRLSISGDWLVVDGFNFDGGALEEENSSIVEFRGSDGDATNSRFTNSAITDYNPSSEGTRYFWVSLYGENNRVDHNSFSGQNHSGVTVVVWRNDASPDHHRIDNNHFVDRPVSSTGANGFEAIRIGTSQQSLSDSFTIVEDNLFERIDGEIEIISVKSGSNIIRNNTFLESAGTLTLRHGNGSLVEGNYFIGNDKDRSGGVRIIGEDHVIVNNYFEGLDGRAGGAISISTGVVGPLNAHAQVKNLLIANNTIVDLNNGSAIFFSEGQGNDNDAGPRTLLADNVTIVNNLISSNADTGDDLFGGDQGTNFTYRDNIAFGASIGSASGFGSGITVTDPGLSVGADNVQRLTSSSPAIDAAFTGFASATGGIDIDGHQRGGIFDIGADEFSTIAPLRGPLTAADVGNCFHEFPGGPPTGGGGNLTGIIDSGLVVQSDEFVSATDPNGDGDTFFIVEGDSTSFGNTHVAAPGGNRTNLPGTQDAVITYNLQFAEAGTYTAYYRARGEDGGTDSFYTPSDFGDDPDNRLNISSPGYDWETGDSFSVSNADLNSVLEFSISKREARAELDVIVFHLDNNLSPSDLDALFFG